MRKVLASLTAMVGLFTSGCATDEGLRLSRQATLPPAYVVKANRDHDLYRNVVIEEVAGAPEFRWFDGGALLTTRPTRAQVIWALDEDLARTDLAAPTRVGSEYMLYVKFEDLHGPDVWMFSDKEASARIKFRLVRWRTGQVVKQADIAVAYQAKFNGIQPEVIRERIAGPIGVANTTPFEPVTIFTYTTESSRDLFVDPLALSRRGKSLTNASELGPFSGTDRRYAATRGMLSLAFDEFMDELSKDGSVTYKRAVACTDLNASYSSHSAAFMLETPDAYAVDCPGSYYIASRVRAMYPSQF
jgi:hypothetical protein